MTTERAKMESRTAGRQERHRVSGNICESALTNLQPGDLAGREGPRRLWFEPGHWWCHSAKQRENTDSARQQAQHTEGESCLGRVECEMPVAHPRGHVQKADGQICRSERGKRSGQS